MRNFTVIMAVLLAFTSLNSCMEGKRQSSVISRTGSNVSSRVVSQKRDRGQNYNRVLLEIPILYGEQPEQIISHLGYTVSYNHKACIANWVAYELTYDEVLGTVPSAKKFTPDPTINSKQANNDDYKYSGWDRGHMCPAADMKWSKQAMTESFYYTNVCPQNPNLNGGDWKALEEKCRTLTQDYGNIYITCGAIIGNSIYGTLGNNSVVIPDAFYKVLLVNTPNGYESIGFYFENKAGHRNLNYYARTVDEIENLTNIDFFHSLPDTIEAAIESKYNLDVWRIN